MAKTFSVTVTDEEYRAFQLLVVDPDGWVDHAVRNKIRKSLIFVAQEIAKDPAGLLTTADRAEIEADIMAEGSAMKEPKYYSKAVKLKMAERTVMKLRVTREAEALAEVASR